MTVLSALVACGTSENESTFVDPSADGAAPIDPLAPFLGADAAAHGPYSDFPATPIVTSDAPANAAALFAGATAAGSGGPCLMEPEVGTMFPKNWIRPRFRWIAAQALAGDAGADGGSTQTLYELRVHVENQVGDLLVYTADRNWTMTKEMWDGLRNHSAGAAITVTVSSGVLEGATLTNVAKGASGPLAIAPVEAPGSIVYWTTVAGGPDPVPGVYNPTLKGFKIGDESVRNVLLPSQLPATGAGPVKCVGCHTSTPDGLFAAVSTRPNASGGGLTQIGFGAVDGSGGSPAYVSASAKTMMERSEQEAPAYSAAHFQPGDRIGLSMLRNAPTSGGFDIAWTDLEATSTAEGTGWGKLARTGDPGFAALANWSHDGTRVAYVSTPEENTSGTIVTKGQLWTVPYANKQGGIAAPLPGVNETGFKLYYPAFSPDDTLIAYDRSPDTQSSYNDPKGEVYVVAASGGKPTRLAANDPPACSGAASPGVYNNWPKWSPEVRVADGKKYYFLVFSSARNTGAARFGARLYVAPVVVSPDGTVKTYSALYLWNQPEAEDNHSPAWDNFQIPDLIK